jgi:hypothetical protein
MCSSVAAVPARPPARRPTGAGLAALLALGGGCALLASPGPPPDAPTESALAAAAAPDVCKVTPGSLRRIGPAEAGVTTLGELFERLGRPPLAPGQERACWLGPGGSRFALIAHGRFADQPVRSLAIAEPDPEAAKGCVRAPALPEPLALEAGLRPGLERARVVEILGQVAVDAEGAFGKECCGLEPTGSGPEGPVYGFGCSAVLGTFKEGKLASLLVSRYAPPPGAPR